MTYSLSLRPRALAEIEAARDRYKLVGHGDAFLDELDAVIEVIQAMPLRFPIVYGTIAGDDEASDVIELFTPPPPFDPFRRGSDYGHPSHASVM